MNSLRKVILWIFAIAAVAYLIGAAVTAINMYTSLDKKLQLHHNTIEQLTAAKGKSSGKKTKAIADVDFHLAAAKRKTKPKMA